METLALLEHYKGGSYRDRRYEGYQPHHETDDDIHDDESHNRATGLRLPPSRCSGPAVPSVQEAVEAP